MSGKLLTVFTPSYNRANLLSRLYESLCRQSSDNFLWLIVDDGSSDHTKELVNTWIVQNRIQIKYIYQENHGMHTAHNTAYQLIDTELNVCIDSDDYMTDDAVAFIEEFWKVHKSEEYAGFIGLDKYINGGIIGTSFPVEMTNTTLLDLYESGGKGDKKLVYRTEVIKKYPEYPVFGQEKYVGLDYKYYLIDMDYKLLVTNTVLCVVDYQADGSGKTMLQQYWNNPNGFIFYRKFKMSLVHSPKRRFIECIHYVSSFIIAGKYHFFKEVPLKMTTFFAIPFGFLFYFYLKYKVGRKYNKISTI